MSATTETVDNALDRYITLRQERAVDGEAPLVVRAKTLAKLAGVSVPQMSSHLQDYRKVQKPGGERTRYVVQCRGYGRNSVWYILAKPGNDPDVVQHARVQAVRWSVQDMTDRFITDTTRELLPGLRGTEADATIQAMTKHVASQLDSLVTFVTSVLGENGQEAPEDIPV